MTVKRAEVSLPETDFDHSPRLKMRTWAPEGSRDLTVCHPSPGYMVLTGVCWLGLNYNSFQPREGLPFVVAGCAGGGEPPTRLALLHIHRWKQLPAGYTTSVAQLSARN